MGPKFHWTFDSQIHFLLHSVYLDSPFAQLLAENSGCGREQEVQAGPASALEAVVAADMQLMALRAEEAELNRRLGVSEGASESAAAQNGHAAPDGASAGPDSEPDPAVASTASGLEQLRVTENGSYAANGVPQNGSSVSAVECSKGAALHAFCVL